MTTINAKSNKKKEYITIKSGSGDDTITLSDGNFRIYSGRGSDTITLSNGDNIVYAQYGNNTITAGTGNDRMYAGKGQDEFVFDTTTFGNNVIYNSNASDSITFGDNLKDNAFEFYRFGNDLVITDNIHTQTDTITLSKYFKGKSKLNTVVQNGKTIEIDKDVLIYYSGKGKVKGTGLNDAMIGSTKKDTLYGYGGNDLLMGGANNDKIYSGSGENTVILNRGDGNDTLYVDNKAVSNTLLFDAGSTLSYTKSGKDLIVNVTNSLLANQTTPDSESVRVKNYFSSKGKDVLPNTLNVGLLGEDTTTNIKSELASSYITQTGSAKKSNKLYGAVDYDNYIVGGDKSDKIYAGDMDNRIYGGKGSDKYYVNSENMSAVTKIFDDSGNETYALKSLDTSVYIDDKSGRDELRVSAGEKYTMFFDVSVDSTVSQYDSLFLVADKNFQSKSYTEYIAGGVEIANYFEDNNYGDGRIEKITVGGRVADVTLNHFDSIRSEVSAWLNLGDNGFSSAMEAFEKGSAEQIQSLIAIYQGGKVTL